MKKENNVRHIILIGFMGAGKSTVGKRLAKACNRKFIDTDQKIEAETGRVISDIFAQDGEEFFRDLETELLKKLKTQQEPLVIAVGGGLPVRAINRTLLKELGTVVYLKAEVDTLEKRLQGSVTRPKLLGGNLRERILSLMEAREEFYQDAAEIVYDTDGKSLPEVVCGLREKIFP